MRISLIVAGLAFAGLGLAGCSTLGERSTLAELSDRCTSRGGNLMPGSSSAEGGVRCLDRAPWSGRGANAGRNVAVSQLSQAIDNQRFR